MSENRRLPVTGLAVAALGVAAAAAATMCVITLGGSASATDPGSAPRTVVATVGPSSPQAVPQAVTVTAEVPVRIERTQPEAAGAALDLRQIVYTIDGVQRPNDPVTVVYADETGSLRTLENVTLPWTLTVVANLPVNYVTANSRGSLLNCWITDAGGNTVVSLTDNGISTTCNR